MSVTSSVPPSVQPADARCRASRPGYRVGGGLVIAACIGAAAWVALAFLGLMDRVNGFQRMTVPGTATVHVAQAATRAAAPPGQLGIGATGPPGNPVVVSAYHGALRYDLPGESGRVGTAIASFQAAVAGDNPIAADPGTSAGGTAATGGEVLWYAVAHLAGSAAVFLARGGAGAALIIITAMRRSRRAASRDTRAACSGPGGRGASVRQVVTWR